MFTGLLIKEIIKDMDEQADKELHRVNGRIHVPEKWHAPTPEKQKLLRL